MTASLLVPLTCRADDIIHVAYSERPPFIVATADGSPAGLAGTPAAHAFKAAGIQVVWHKVPTNRQLVMMKAPDAQLCGVGWFWVAEREQFAKFSKPLYRDKDWMVLANVSLAARGYTSLAELQQHRDTRILVKDNYSYGIELDKLLRDWRPTPAVSTTPTSKMVQSISKGAVDMMFVPEEEGEYIMTHNTPERLRNLRLLRFKDMPRGAERHIMCSKNVPDDVIARLNKAITFK